MRTAWTQAVLICPGRVFCFRGGPHIFPSANAKRMAKVRPGVRFVVALASGLGLRPRYALKRPFSLPPCLPGPALRTRTVKWRGISGSLCLSLETCTSRTERQQSRKSLRRCWCRTRCSTSCARGTWSGKTSTTTCERESVLEGDGSCFAPPAAGAGVQVELL